MSSQSLCISQWCSWSSASLKLQVVDFSFLITIRKRVAIAILLVGFITISAIYMYWAFPVVHVPSSLILNHRKDQRIRIRGIWMEEEEGLKCGCWVKSSGRESFPSVPIMQARLPLGMATAKHWNIKGYDLLYLPPVALQIMRPSSFKKEKVSGPNVPDVSTTMTSVNS